MNMTRQSWELRRKDNSLTSSRSRHAVMYCSSYDWRSTIGLSTGDKGSKGEFSLAPHITNQKPIPSGKNNGGLLLDRPAVLNLSERKKAVAQPPMESGKHN